MATIGFIGLGNMGRPMASNLVRKGFSLVVHDVVAKPVDALAALGATPKASVADVTTASDIVITMLPDSAHRGNRDRGRRRRARACSAPAWRSWT